MVWSRGDGGGRVAVNLLQRSQVSVPLCPTEDMEEDCRDLPGVGDLRDTERQTETARKTETEASQCFCVSLDGGGGSGHSLSSGWQGGGISRLCLAVTLGETPLH